MSFSDHEGVAAKLNIRRQPQRTLSNREFVRSQSRREVDMKKTVIEQAKEILEESLRQTGIARLFYLLTALFCFTLLVVTFIPIQLAELYLVALLDLGLFLVRLCLIVSITYLCL